MSLESEASPARGDVGYLHQSMIQRVKLRLARVGQAKKLTGVLRYRRGGKTVAPKCELVEHTIL
jgi:hypothetical protein